MIFLSTKRDLVMLRTWDTINKDQQIQLAIETASMSLAELFGFGKSQMIEMLHEAKT